MNKEKRLTDAELDDLCKRLRGETGDAAIASFEAADAIAALREQVANRDGQNARLIADNLRYTELNQKAEADNAALREKVAELEITASGFTALAERNAELQADNAALQATFNKFRKDIADLGYAEILKQLEKEKTE